MIAHFSPRRPCWNKLVYLKIALVNGQCLESVLSLRASGGCTYRRDVLGKIFSEDGPESAEQPM